MLSEYGGDSVGTIEVICKVANQSNIIMSARKLSSTVGTQSHVRFERSMSPEKPSVLTSRMVSGPH